MDLLVSLQRNTLFHTSRISFRPLTVYSKCFEGNFMYTFRSSCVYRLYIPWQNEDDCNNTSHRTVLGFISHNGDARHGWSMNVPIPNLIKLIKQNHTPERLLWLRFVRIPMEQNSWIYLAYPVSCLPRRSW